MIFRGYLAVRFGPSVQRFSPALEYRSSFDLAGTCPEERRVLVVMQNIPSVRADAIWDVTEDEMNMSLRQRLDRGNAVGVPNLR